MYILFLFLHIYMYLVPYLPEKASLSPSSVRITATRRRDVSPHHDPDAAAGMEVQPPVAMGQPADAAAMEDKAPNATAMEDQPPDAMAGPLLPLAVAAEGHAAVEDKAPNATAMEDQPPDAMAVPSLPLAVAAEGQATVTERLATRARDDLADLGATDARGLPAPIAKGLAASVDDVAVPEGSMDGEAPQPATAFQATAIRFFYCP
jgi:hypothetical protein